MNQPNQTSFSEIVESSLHTFTAQCWRWNQFPTFGQLVTVQAGSRTIFGIVHEVNTGSMDPVRYPFPYQKTEEELLREQPQIFEFLKTTFQCITVGYLENSSIFYLVPPEPTKIHSFVASATPDIARTFFKSPDYLHLLFGQSTAIQGLDELLLALIKEQAALGIINRTNLGSFVDHFSLLTGNDYRRLKILLQRVEPLVTT
jgi:hypothetical protein